MATHQSKAQKETVERVMHEFKHGELKTSRGRKVKNPKQAIAIGLHEAGASKYESKEKNRETLKRTKRHERKGETAKDSQEGRETKSELYAQARRRQHPRPLENGQERAKTRSARLISCFVGAAGSVFARHVFSVLTATFT